MLIALALLHCLGAGLIGGVFLAFSSFVMKALVALPDRQGIAAMQRINLTVLNPLFLGVFLGTAVLSLLCVVAAFLQQDATRSVFLVLAGLLYLVGSFGVTVAFNVPRNERLARLDAGSPEAAAYWPVFVREWLVWNHVRAASSVASAGFAAAALAR